MQNISAVLGSYTLLFNGDTGAWLSLSKDGRTVLSGHNGLPEITLTTDGVTTVATGRGHLDNIRNATPIGNRWKLASHEFKGDGIELTLTEGEWSVVESFRYDSAGKRIERRARIAYGGTGEHLLRFAHMNMPQFDSAALDTLEMPGYSGVLHQPIAGLPIGRYPLALDGADVDGANWRPGVLAAGGEHGSLVTWLYGCDMPAIWQVYNGKDGAWGESKWVCCCRMEEGVSVEIGTQYLVVDDGSPEQALGRIRPFWREVGLFPKQPAEEWVKTAFIYEAQIGPKGSRSGKQHNPYPNPRDLTADLGRIRDLGFTVIELMPHFPYPGYSVNDYFNIDECYGDKRELHELIAAAHSIGIKIFLDVVMHGVSDKSIRPEAPTERHPLLDEHPEFFVQTEDGRVARTYTWSFDQANPELREYIKEVFCYYVSELDADGFRVDALTWNYFPNWKKGIGYPAYKSIDGCFELFEHVRDAVWAIKPGVAFYSETTGPLMARSYDLSYNYDEVWMYENLLPLPAWAQNLGNWNKLPAGRKVDARAAAEWLALRQKVLPENWTKVHHADSHDTYEWGGLGAFRRENMGKRQAVALFAYCCFVEGAVMNYVGGEWGSEETYKNLIRARKSHPALLRGECDYTAVEPENRNLFAPLRRCGKQTVLPLINFSPDEAVTRLDLRGTGIDCSVEWLLEEHFSGTQIRLAAGTVKELAVTLPGYGYQLWEIKM